MTMIEIQMLDENEQPYTDAQLRTFEQDFNVTIIPIEQDAGPLAPTFRITGERQDVEVILHYQFPDDEIEDYEVAE